MSPVPGVSGAACMREAVVLAKLGPGRYFRPHPYAPEVQGGLPFHAADHAQWDTEFPDHAPTRVRRTFDVLAAAVTVAPDFTALPPFIALPPFAGPAAANGWAGGSVQVNAAAPPLPWDGGRRRRVEQWSDEPTHEVDDAGKQVGQEVHLVFLLVRGASVGLRSSGLQPVDCALQSSRPGRVNSNESPDDHTFQRTSDPVFVCSGIRVFRSSATAFVSPGPTPWPGYRQWLTPRVNVPAW